VPAGIADIDPACLHDLFRCAQEAITNAVKHASARNVWVTAVCEPEVVRLSVRDDGRGAKNLAVGHGLSGMRQRVASWGGGSEFHSPAHAGFAVELWVPRR
jgi:signal transduction histidine kinase